MKTKTKAKKSSKKKTQIKDRHILYEHAVQCPEADVDFFERIYKKKNGQRFDTMREDFCGTAALACDFVRRRASHRAWGVDIDGPTLAWAREHNLPMLGKGIDRLELIQEDVFDVKTPKVDVVAALNFSYNLFKERERLLGYFRAVRKAMKPGGVFFMDCFGGADVMCETEEKRRIKSGKRWDGTKIPAFSYIWDQARFNPIDHEMTCHIHFKLPDGTKMKRAFTYNWRIWTIPELRELLSEAGFASSEVYVEGWDDEEDESDGIFRKRKYFENQAAWIAYIVAYTD